MIVAVLAGRAEAVPVTVWMIVDGDGEDDGPPST